MSHTATFEYPIHRPSAAPIVLRRTAELVLRGYIALVWLRFGITKLRDGWFTSNPIRPLMTMIGAEQLPTTAPGYSLVAKLIVATRADVLLSIAIPCAEIAIGAAILSGVRVRTAALVACALNINLILAGVGAPALDGRMIVLQLALIALLTRGSGLR